MGIISKTPLDENYKNSLVIAIGDGANYERVPTYQFSEEFNKIKSLNPTLFIFPTIKKTGKIYSNFLSGVSYDFTASRASTGSYISVNSEVKMAVANEPRFEYKNGTIYKGVLVEPASNNILLSTSNFSSPWGVSTRHQITNDNFILGAGKNLKVLETDGINNQAISNCIRQTITFASGSNSLSFFVKKTTNHSSIGVWAFHPSGSYSVGFDVDTKTVSRPQTSIVFTDRFGEVIDLGNNIFYCYETFKTAETSSRSIGFSPTTSGAQNMVIGQEISIGGIQLEARYSPTSYIPVSKSADLCESELLNYNTTEYSFFFDIEYLYPYVADTADISANPLIWYFRRINGNNQVNFWNQNAQQNLGSYAYPTNQKRFRGLLTFNGSTISTYVNGNKVGNAITPTNLSPYQTMLNGGTNRFRLSKASLGFGLFDSPHYIRYAAVFTRALSDQDAIFLTTI